PDDLYYDCRQNNAVEFMKNIFDLDEYSSRHVDPLIPQADRVIQRGELRGFLEDFKRAALLERYGRTREVNHAAIENTGIAALHALSKILLDHASFEHYGDSSYLTTADATFIGIALPACV
ncbi:Unknown protein, partial [Striga hermonthica]